MNAVVERCPNCGVEHDVSHVGPCEVCGHELRYWCQRHSRDVGWLDGPECPVCRREEEAARTPRAAPPAARRAPERTLEGVEVRREPRGPSAEDLAPHVATGAGVALRVVAALVVLVRTVVLWALLGAAAGVAYAFLAGGELLWLAALGLVNGALLGLVLGFLAALVTLFRRERRH